MVPSPNVQLYVVIGRPPPVDVDALKKTVSPTPGDAGEKVNVAVGVDPPAPPAATTVTVVDVTPVCPRSSVTVRTTVKAPAVAKSCVVVTPVFVVPSPKSQA